MTNVEYINPRSGALWSSDVPIWCAPDDGGYVNLTPGTGLTRQSIAPGEIGLWRYRKAIRLPRADTSTLGEGWTPLVPSDWDGASVLMKCEHMMPSGSFKDRGTAVLFNYLKQCGTTEILEDSSGNAGASYATYAAALGLDCRIMVPASAPAWKKTQIAAMGARVEAIEGSREDVAAAALKAAEVTFYASHNWQPFFIEGTKTLAFEIWEQLDFSVPDNIVVPLGYGSNVIGLYLGFLELQVAGEIDRLPRIFGAQAANCAALYAAWQAGGTAVDFPISATLADGIASEKPVRVAEVMTATRQTGGAIVAADEDEIAASFQQLAGGGLFVEPTSATAGAVLSRLIATGIVAREEATVLVLTGHGLKAVDKIARMSES
ncbi:MAG: threonine synthase [Alphaproteobacteria bacterium]|mgnify:FL=1|jgi:threonine synthase|nr:threonine synthase [Alphaproteobacteria bacterium]